MKKRFALTVAILMLFSTVAYAGPAYFGVGLHSGVYRESFADVDITGVRLKGGAYLADYFAVEVHYLYGQGEYYFVDLTGSIVSLFARGDLALSETVRLYGLLGYSSATLEASAYGYSVSIPDDGLSYGGGVEFEISKKVRFGIEGIMYIDETFYDYSGITASIILMF